MRSADCSCTAMELSILAIPTCITSMRRTSLTLGIVTLATTVAFFESGSFMESNGSVVCWIGKLCMAFS